MLSNAYFLAKFRFDTAENEPAKSLQHFIFFFFPSFSFERHNGDIFEKCIFEKCIFRKCTTERTSSRVGPPTGRLPRYDEKSVLADLSKFANLTGPLPILPPVRLCRSELPSPFRHLFSLGGRGVFFRLLRTRFSPPTPRVHAKRPIFLDCASARFAPITPLEETARAIVEYWRGEVLPEQLGVG